MVRNSGNSTNATINVDVIVGAVASAIRQSLNTSVSQGPGISDQSVRSDPGEGGSSSSSSKVAATPLQRPTTYDRASDLSTPSQKRPKFTPPSLFENLRSRRGGRGKKAAPKTTCYVRDIVLLPSEFRNRYSEITIPRRTKRSLLATAGLVGKIEIDSGMSQDDVHREICEVYSEPMGLSLEDIKNNRFFSISVPTTCWSRITIPLCTFCQRFISVERKKSCIIGKGWLFHIHNR